MRFRAIKIWLMIFFWLLVLSCSKDAQEITGSGSIEAVELSVSAKIGGVVEALLVEEGSELEIGDTVAVIEHSGLDLQLKQAEAGLEMAKAQLELLLKGARSEDLRQAEEGLKQAKVNLDLAKSDYQRIQNLYENDNASKKQRDDAEARYQVALAQYNSAQAVYKKIQNLARPEEIRTAEARLKQAEAGVELAQKAISDCYLISPIKGVVTKKLVERGELVAPGYPLVTISQLDKVYLMIYVTELELSKVKLGQEAIVKIDAEPKKDFKGKVVYISPVAEFTPKNIQTKEERVKLVFGVKIGIDNPEGVFKPGLPADASLKVQSLSSK